MTRVSIADLGDDAVAQIMEVIRRDSERAKTMACSPRRGKYGNMPVVVDGLRFDSKKEAKRWGQLMMLANAGVITDLRRQVPYPLHANGIRVGDYMADFEYRDGDGRVVLEDVKGGRATATALYRWKRKHVAAEYGILIREVTE